MAPHAPWIAAGLGLLVGACLDAGVALELELEDGLVVLVERRDDQPLRWRSGPELVVPWVSEPDTELYVLRLTASAVGAAQPGADVQRLGQSTIALRSADLAECAPHRFHRSAQQELLEVGLPGVAEVYQLRTDRFEPIAEWPEALDALSLLVPAVPCKTRAARVEPFLGEVGPVLRRGDRLGSMLVDSNVGTRTRISFVSHLDEDHLVVGLNSALLVLTRGGGSQGAPILEFSVSPELWGGPPEPGVSLFLLRARRIPGPAAPGRARLILVLGEHREGPQPQLGVRIAEVEAGPDGFGVPRLLHRAEHVHEGLAWVSADTAGRFAAVGTRWLEVGRLDGTGVPETRTDLGGYEVLLSSESSPQLIIGERPLAWRQGDPANLDSLEQVRAPVPPRQNSTYVSVLRRLGQGPQTRLYAGTSDSTLFEWTGAGWQPLPIWYLEDIPGCTGAFEQCGRIWPRNVTGLKDLDLTSRAELVFLLRDCGAIFLVDPDRLGCVDHVQPAVDAYANDGDERLAFNHLSVWQDRVLIVGERGLLFELLYD